MPSIDTKDLIRFLQVTLWGTMKEIFVGDTFWVMEGSWVLSRRSQTSTVPSCFVMKKTAGREGDQCPEVRRFEEALEHRMGPVWNIKVSRY